MPHRTPITAAAAQPNPAVTHDQYELMIQQAIAQHDAMPHPPRELADALATVLEGLLSQKAKEERRLLHIRRFVRECGRHGDDA